MQLTVKIIWVGQALNELKFNLKPHFLLVFRLRWHCLMEKLKLFKTENTPIYKSSTEPNFDPKNFLLQIESLLTFTGFIEFCHYVENTLQI